MPLNVLAVDVDKLLKHKVRIPPPEPTLLLLTTPSIPCGTRHTPVQQGETPKSRRGCCSTSPRRVDCFLLKGDDGQGVWHGAVRKPNELMSPSQRSSPSGRSPRHQRKVRRFSVDSSSPEDQRSPIDNSGLMGAVEDGDLPGGEAFRVEIGWVPTESYRHTHAVLVPLPPMRSRDSGSGGKRASSGGHAVGDSPMSILSAEPLSRPQTGGVAPSSRGSSANTARLGSARKVRLVGIDDGGDGVTGTVAASAPDADAPPQPSPRSQRTPTNASKPPLGGGGLFQSQAPSAAVQPAAMQHPMSATARDIIHTTLSYVHGRMDMMLQAAPLRPQQPTIFRNGDVQRRLLSPRAASVSNGSDGCGCGPHGGHKRVPSDRIIAAVSGTVSARQESIIREKERLLSLAVLRQDNLVTPQCSKSLPSTLETFRRSLQSKTDPMFASVFDAQYVKPPRTYHSRAAPSARSIGSTHEAGSASLTPHEQSVYNILVQRK